MKVTIIIIFLLSAQFLFPNSDLGISESSASNWERAGVREMVVHRKGVIKSEFGNEGKRFYTFLFPNSETVLKLSNSNNLIKHNLLKLPLPQGEGRGEGQYGFIVIDFLHSLTDLGISESPVSNWERAGMMVSDSLENQIPQNDFKTYFLTDTVVVTADRQSQNLMNVNSSISVLSSEEISLSQPRTTPEALLTTPGVFMQKTNHGGGSPFVRGLTGQQTLILIDGIRLNNSITRSGPNQYLNTVDHNSLNRIEVLKGAGSVEYGSDAIGGTVNLITEKPDFSKSRFYLNSELNAHYMTNDMEKSGHLKIKGGNKNIAFLGGFTYSDYGDIYGGSDSELQSPSGYEQISGNFALKLKTSENSSLLLSSELLQQNEVPIYHKVVLEDYEFNYFEPQYRNLNYVDFSGINPGKNVFNKIFSDYSIKLFNANTEEGRILKKNSSDIKREDNDKLTNYGFSAQFGSQFSSIWNMTSGVEGYFDKVNSARKEIDLNNNSTEFKRGLYPDNSEFNNISIFNLHKFKYHSFIFDAGIRYNTYKIFVPEETLGDIEIFPQAFIWKAGIAKKFGKKHLLGFSVNKAFRAPNIDDMGTLGIVDFRYEVPANDLEPESSINMEMNYKLNLERLWFEISLYRNELTDFIKRERATYGGADSIDGYPVYMKMNTSEAYIQGLETYAKYQINSKLNTEAFLTYTYGQDVTSDSPMRRIPPLYGMLKLNYAVMNNLFVSGELLFAGKQDRLSSGDIDDNRIPEGGTDSWQVLNIYTNYRYKGFDFYLALQNLLNEDYRYHGSGINMYGRSGKFGINYNLDV